MYVFMFPGQGSQKNGMGGDLFDTVQEFRDIESQIDSLLGYSIRELCLQNPDNKLQLTNYTQPALYTINALHYYNALSQGECPDIVIGHSLGEYNALLAAGAYDFLDGLSLVKKRGELMSKAVGGAMAAVIGLCPEDIDEALKKAGLDGIDIANYNAPLQTVISGDRDEIGRVEPILKSAGATACITLPVSAAFHSRYMVEACKEFNVFMSGYKFNSLKLPVVANVTGELYPDGNVDRVVRSMLIKQMAMSVQWTKTIKSCISYGASVFKEIGPGAVLQGLEKQIRTSLEQEKELQAELDYAN